MRSRSASRVRADRITTELVAELLSGRLRQLMGPGRRWSYSGVAQLTGIDERSLRAYAAGTNCPNLARYKRLLAVLGPELAADIDRMLGWSPRLWSDLPPGTLDVEKLRDAIAEALDALNSLAASTGR